MRSVRTKVVGLVVSALIITQVLYSLLLYFNVKKITVTSREDQLSSLAVAVSHDMALWFNAKKAEMSAVADSISLTGFDRSLISRRLKLHAKNNPDYEMVFYADMQGNSFTSSDKKANIADRPYFKSVLLTGGGVVSDPVISRQSHKPIVVIAVPIKKGTAITGVIGCAISLDYLSERVARIKVMKTGYAFVLQGDGLTIMHPDKSLVLKHNAIMDPTIDPALKDAVRKMMQRQTGLTKYVYKNIAKYVAFAPIPGINWSIAINAPIDEVLGQLSPINKLITLAPIMVIIIASSLISFFLIVFIVKPITHLKNMMSRVREGNLDVRMAQTSHDELGELADSFNHMVQTIKEGRDRLLQSEEKYRTTLENIDEGLYEIDLSGNLKFLSHSAVFESLGYSQEEFFRMNYREYMDQENANKISNAFKDVYQTDQPAKNVHFELIGKNGSKMTVETSLSLIRDATEKPIGFRGLIRDITERIRANEALRESELFSREMQRIARLGGWKANPETDYLKWTDGVYDVIEVPRDYAPPLSEGIKFFREDYRPVIQKSLTMCLATGEPFTIECEMETATRKHLWAEIRGLAPVVEGERTSVVGTFQDITDRKRAEEAQRESEQMIQSILSATPVGIGLTVDGQIKWVNENWMQIFGFKEDDEYLNQPVGVLYPSEEIYQESQHRISVSLEKETVGRIETLMKRRDGTIFHAYQGIAPIDPADLKKGTISTIMDISAWKQMEQSLRESEEKYRLAMDVTNDGLWDWDIPTGEVHYSPAWSRILEETIDPHISSWKTRLHPDERDALLQSISNHLEGKNEHWRLEHRLRTSSGKWKWVLGRGSVISRDPDGTPLRMIGTIIDIDERKLLESQLTQAQKMEALGTLAGGIAHDFNNILGAIMGYTELSMIQNRQDSYLQHVMQASERAKSLVDQILVFSRQREQERKPVDVKLIVREAIKLLTASLPSTIEIRQELPSEPSIVNADPTQIHQIIMNLCTNAAYALRDQIGFIEIALSNLDVSPEMTVANPDFRIGPYVHLKVEDSGEGIDPFIIDKIFDPFFTTKKAGEGTGLGLSVVYGIVIKYEGVITVKSAPGEGTTFDIYIPRIVTDIHTGEKGRNVSLLQGNERIFIIDDEEDLAIVLQKYLNSLGYDAIFSTSSMAALEQFQSNPTGYDLIVTDMTMPQMTGLTLSRKILALKPDMPIILCTGYDKTITKDEAQTHGIREFALKPINPRTLAALIRKVLDGRSSFTD